MNKLSILNWKHAAIWISGVYILLGIFWILFSDQLILLFWQDIDQLTRIQTFKGWIFVIGSGIVIYLIVNMSIHNLEEAFTSIKEKDVFQQNLLDRHHQPLFQTDKYGHCIFTNEKWKLIVGQKISPLKPFSWFNYIHPEDRDIGMQSFTKGFMSKKSFSLSYRILLSNGKYKWFENTCFPYQNSKNEFSGMIGLMFDVDKKKKLEEELLIKTQRYKGLFSFNPIPMIIYDEATSKINEVNDAAIMLYGYSLQEFLNLDFNLLNADRNAIIDNNDNKKNNGYIHSKQTHRSKSGDIFHVLVSKYILKNTEEKQIIALCQNITEQVKNEQEKDFQTYFLNLILDNLPFPFFYKDTKGKYLGCNKSFSNLLNLKKEEIIGKTVFDIFEKSQAVIFDNKDQELLRSGSTQQYETMIQYPDGKEMSVVFHKIVFFNHKNDPLGIIGVYFDISERVKAERLIREQVQELSRINKELERYSYTVSHDLRSPLITIQGFLNIVKDEIIQQNAPELHENIIKIEDAADKMHQLIEDLLNYSRVERKTNCFETVNMTVIANEAKSLLHGVSKSKNCIIEIDENMPDEYADKTLIRELFQNLIENAIKFSLENDNEKMVKVFCTKQENQNIYCIQDKGKGIIKKDQTKIFELFNKLDSTTSGSGLGLALVKHIVEKHNGNIWVNSEGKNKGSVFCFTINKITPLSN